MKVMPSSLSRGWSNILPDFAKRHALACRRSCRPTPSLFRPLSLVETTIEDAQVSHLVTLINGETMVPTPPSITPDRHLRLDMNDICEPITGLVLPCEEHVADLVQFALDWDRQGAAPHPLLGRHQPLHRRGLHLALRAQSGSRRARLGAERCARPPAPPIPTAGLVALGDEVLSRQGRMIAAVERIGRGEIAEEGQVFGLSARNAA